MCKGPVAGGSEVSAEARRVGRDTLPPHGSSWEVGLLLSAAGSHWRTGAWRCPTSHGVCGFGGAGREGRGLYWGQTTRVDRGTCFPCGLSEGQDQVGGAVEHPPWALLSLCEFALLKTALLSVRDLESP